MSTEPVASNEAEDLDTFASTFFSKTPAKAEATPEPEAPVEEPEDEDEIEPEDTSAEDETPEDEGAVKPEPKKKNRFQERIDELTGKAREAQRERDNLFKELSEIKQKLEGKKEDPKPAQIESTDGPNPEDQNEDGTDKYPLGEFDPQYIRALTRYTLKAERDAQRKDDEAEVRERQAQEERSNLATEWQSKLGPAKERYPDFEEEGNKLMNTFSEIDQGYGEYLAGTIMGMDHGPDVLYYLSQNLDEADKIVKSGILKATLALGKIQAKFEEDAETKKISRVSKAPTPPDRINKGSAVSKSVVSDDTDDLDAFSQKFFKKK